MANNDKLEEILLRYAKKPASTSVDPHQVENMLVS